MTIEQAITVLRGMKIYLCSGNPIWRTDLIKESVSMAIEALEQANTPQTDLVEDDKCFDCEDFFDCDEQTDCPWK